MNHVSIQFKIPYVGKIHTINPIIIYQPLISGATVTDKSQTRAGALQLEKERQRKLVVAANVYPESRGWERPRFNCL